MEEEVPDYPVHLFFTKEGYFKKITPQSLRMSGEQKLKEGDEITQQLEAQNTAELLFFSNKSQVYKMKAADFADTKASVLGEYIPARARWTRGRARCTWPSPTSTRASCCSSLRTARWPRWR
mgnify:CR=1 FL=1